MVTEEEILDQARRSTGLSDFGESEEFRVGLRVLIASAAEEDLTDAQRQTLERTWLANLEVRLRLVDERKRHPEIADEVIEGPLVVIGLPRTGTTTLVELLAQDPAARAPLQWEIPNLFPPPSKATWATDPRIAALQAEYDKNALTSPIYRQGLRTPLATSPEECNLITAIDFWSSNLSAYAYLPRYVEWQQFTLPRRPYLAHKWVLQHLQAHGPAGRWTLKSPNHCFALPSFVAEYPGAMFVQNHREPAELVVSIAGMLSIVRGFPPGHPGRAITAREQLEEWGLAMQRSMAARADPALDARVLDISHRAMVKDPAGTFRRIYERFGLPLTEAAKARVAAWAQSPTQRKSEARFTLEDFGLTQAEVDQAFGPYRERFAEYL